MATKAIVESKTISLYMCRGNRLHILNCKKTPTKGGSTSKFMEIMLSVELRCKITCHLILFGLSSKSGNFCLGASFPIG